MALVKTGAGKIQKPEKAKPAARAAAAPKVAEAPKMEAPIAPPPPAPEPEPKKEVKAAPRDCADGEPVR